MLDILLFLMEQCRIVYARSPVPEARDHARRILQIDEESARRFIDVLSVVHSGTPTAFCASRTSRTETALSADPTTARFVSGTSKRVKSLVPQWPGTQAQCGAWRFQRTKCRSRRHPLTRRFASGACNRGRRVLFLADAHSTVIQRRPVCHWASRPRSRRRMTYPCATARLPSLHSRCEPCRYMLPMQSATRQASTRLD